MVNAGEAKPLGNDGDGGGRCTGDALERWLPVAASIAMQSSSMEKQNKCNKFCGLLTIRRSKPLTYRRHNCIKNIGAVRMDFGISLVRNGDGSSSSSSVLRRWCRGVDDERRDGEGRCRLGNPFVNTLGVARRCEEGANRGAVVGGNSRNGGLGGRCRLCGHIRRLRDGSVCCSFRK